MSIQRAWNGVDGVPPPAPQDQWTWTARVDRLPRPDVVGLLRELHEFVSAALSDNWF